MGQPKTILQIERKTSTVVIPEQMVIVHKIWHPWCHSARCPPAFSDLTVLDIRCPAIDVLGVTVPTPAFPASTVLALTSSVSRRPTSRACPVPSAVPCAQRRPLCPAPSPVPSPPMAPTVPGVWRPSVDVPGITAPGAHCPGVLSFPCPCHKPSLGKKRVTCARQHLRLVALISLLGESVYRSGSVRKKELHANKTVKTKDNMQ